MFKMPNGSDWAYGLMDMTSVYETEDCRFEPCFAQTLLFASALLSPDPE